MNDDVFAAALVQTDRLHQAAAACPAISRHLLVHMFAVKALGAVVCVAGSSDLLAAVPADEVLRRSYEVLSADVHIEILVRWSPEFKS